MSRNISVVLSLALLLISGSSFAADVDWSKVDDALGRKGAMQPGGIYKYGLPRTDFKITVDGVAIEPALAFGSWVAFQPMDRGAMVMGDLVLTDTELSPVMKRLIDAGFEISAIHNHLMRTSAPVFYMHIGAQGDAVKLAQTVKAALALSKTPLTAPAHPAAPPAIDLDTAAIEKSMGYRGKPNGGVLQFSIPRAEEIREGGMAVPPAMGTAIAINFQPTGSGKAAITGDFVLLGKEVNPVLKMLRQKGIEVTALHSHLIDESPRLYFMHFWANEDALELAQGLRAALDLTNARRGT